MSIEQNKTIARRIFAALNERDMDGVIAHYKADCRFHGWGPDTLKTLDVAGNKETMMALLDAFPNSQFPVHDIIAEDNRVAVPHSFQGTHLADFQGIPPTGKSVAVNAIVIFHMENDKVAETWLSADFVGLMQQLGVIPTPETS